MRETLGYLVPGRMKWKQRVGIALPSLYDPLDRAGSKSFHTYQHFKSRNNKSLEPKPAMNFYYQLYFLDFHVSIITRLRDFPERPCMFPLVNNIRPAPCPNITSRVSALIAKDLAPLNWEVRGRPWLTSYCKYTLLLLPTLLLLAYFALNQKSCPSNSKFGGWGVICLFVSKCGVAPH